MRTRIGPSASARLASSRRRDSVGSARERHEERVALGIDLDARVCGEGIPQQPPVLGKKVGVCRSVLLKESRRALDVREEEGDGAGRERRACSRRDHLIAPAALHEPTDGSSS